MMKPINISINTVAVVTGAVLVLTYIFFGGSRTKKIKKKSHKKDDIPGLINIGNSCFLNCILQALASCPSFLRWLRMSEKPVLISSLYEVVNELNGECCDGAASAHDVLKALRSYGWVISPEEQDAHELFHALTSTIDDEISLLDKQSRSLFNVSWIGSENFEFKDNIKEKSDQNSEKDNANSELNFVPIRQKNLSETDIAYFSPIFKTTVRRQGLFNNILVHQMGSASHLVSKCSAALKNYSFSSTKRCLESPFKGNLASQLQCCVCGYKNAVQWSTFESLSLSLPGRSSSSSMFSKSSLQELLSAFVRKEFVTDVTCDGCTSIRGSSTQTMFTKQLTLGKLPECLCIHIQRNVWLDNGCVAKRKDFVQIPEILNMTPYTYSLSINYENTLDEEKSQNPLSSIRFQMPKSGEAVCNLTNSSMNHDMSNKDHSHKNGRKLSLYKLQSVVVHVGDAFSGHFVTYRRGPVNTHLNERWFYTSDVIVNKVSLEEVLKSNAYMVIYQRLTS